MERTSNTLDELIGWNHGLTAYCDPCNIYKPLDLPAFAARFGGEMTTDELRDRLVCSGCGRRRPKMLLTSIGGWDGAYRPRQ